MSVALTALETFLQEAVPQQDSRPTNAQYTAAVKSAVAAFNEKRGRVATTTLSIVSGTASYTMPDDFFDLIEVKDAAYDSVAIGTDGQLIPLSRPLAEERFLVSGRTITISPEPSYTLDRTIFYRAGHVLDNSDDYPNMTVEEQEIILIKAQANALRYLMMGVALNAFRYSVGDVTVDKGNQAKGASAVIADLDEEFNRRVERLVGAVGAAGPVMKED